ncbi:MAG: pentapeptide repeat-containing protein, partial [Cyanobacteria bacterium J06555_13]
WQTITSAHEQEGNGGRIQALEFLNASPGANWRRRFPWFCAPIAICIWPAESLSNVDLTPELGEIVKESSQELSNDGQSENAEKSTYFYLQDESDISEINTIQLSSIYESDTDSFAGAYLRQIQLPDSDLRSAKLSRANLTDSNFERASLEFADLQRANLWAANLKKADLRGANLRYTALVDSQLKDALLEETTLEGAIIAYANFEKADLRQANLKGAYLLEANFEGSNLEFADLDDAILVAVDLKGAKGLDVNQLVQAKLCKVSLPSDISLSPNRDCLEIGFDPETGEYAEN